MNELMHLSFNVVSLNQVDDEEVITPSENCNHHQCSTCHSRKYRHYVQTVQLFFMAIEPKDTGLVEMTSSSKTFMENGSNTGAFTIISRVGPVISLTEVVEEEDKIEHMASIHLKYNNQFNATRRSADEVEISISDRALSDLDG